MLAAHQVRDAVAPHRAGNLLPDVEVVRQVAAFQWVQERLHDGVVNHDDTGADRAQLVLVARVNACSDHVLVLDLAPVRPLLIHVARHVALVFILQLFHGGRLFWPFLQHFAQLVFHVARLFGQITNLLRSHLLALVDAFAVVDRLAAGRVRPDVARVDAEGRRAALLNDLNLVDRGAADVGVRTPCAAGAVDHDRAFQHASAQHCSVVDHLALLTIEVAFDQLIFDLAGHRIGFALRHVHHLAGDVFHPQLLGRLHGCDIAGQWHTLLRRLTRHCDRRCYG